ncbi:MAG: hypothetical protein GF308_21435 [Candidatus Heimdallarchaeota archaeon]|nr:hypothetical protein [Candidatus Heimdallarchaeota archaeon]
MSKNSTIEKPEIRTVLQELERGDKLAPFEVISRNKIGHTMEITSVVELPDGNIMSASKDETVRIWDINSGKCLKIFINNDSRLMKLLPKNRFICTGSDNSRNNPKGAQLTHRMIFLKDSATGKILQKMGENGKNARINALTVGDSKIYTAGFREIHIWSLETGEKLNSFNFNLRRQKINCLTLLSDGRLVFGTKYSSRKCGGVKIWDIDNKEIIDSHMRHTDDVNAIVEWEDKIISASKDQTIRIWKPNEDKNQTILRGHRSSINALALLPDGRIVSGSGDNYSYGDITIRIWSQESGACLRVFKGHSARISCLTITRDGKIVSGSKDKTIRIWDPETGECLLVLGEKPPAIAKILFNPTEREFIVNAQDMLFSEPTTDFYSLNSGIVIRSLASGVFSHGMTFLPDGRFVSVEKGNISIRSPSGCLLKTIPTKVSSEKTLIVLPNGNIVTAYKDIKVWSPNTGRCIKEITTHKEKVVLLALIQGDKLLSTSADATRLWSTRTWRRLETYLNKGFGKVLLLSDGQLLTLKSDGEKYFAIWSLKTGKLVKKTTIDVYFGGNIGKILREIKQKEKEFPKDFDINGIINRVIGNEEIPHFVQRRLNQIALFSDGTISTVEGGIIRTHVSDKKNSFKKFEVPNINYFRAIKSHPKGLIIALIDDSNFLLLDPLNGLVVKKFENATLFDVNSQGLFLIKTGKNKITIQNQEKVLKTFEVENTTIYSGYFLNNNSIVIYGESTKDEAAVILVSDPEQKKWIYELKFIDVTKRTRWRRYPKIEHNLFSEKIVQLTKKNVKHNIKKAPPRPGKKEVEGNSKIINMLITDFLSGVQNREKSKLEEVRKSPKKVAHKEARNITKKLIGHEGPITSICIDQKGRIVTIARDETIRVWCPQTGNCLKTLDDLGQHNSKTLTVSPKNQIISFPSNTNTKEIPIKIYDIDNEKRRKIVFPRGFSVVQISSNNELILFDQHDHLFKAIAIDTGEVSDLLQNFYSSSSYYQHPKPIEPSVFLLPDKTIITANKTGVFRSWEWDTEFFLVKDSLQTYKGHTAILNAIAQLPDGRIITGAQDETIRLWDPETGKCLKTISFYAKEFDLKVLSNRKILLGDTEKRKNSLKEVANLWVLDLQTEERIPLDQEHPIPIENMKILSNKLILVHLQNGGIRLYSFETLERLGNLNPTYREEELVCLGMIDEERIAIYSNYLGTIAIWSLQEKREEVIFYPPKSMIRSKLQQIDCQELDQVSIRLKEGYRLHHALRPYNELFGVSFERRRVLEKIIDQKKQEIKKEPEMISAVKELVESFCSSFNLLSLTEKNSSEKEDIAEYHYLTRPLKSKNVIFTAYPIYYDEVMDEKMVSLTIPLLTDEQLTHRREWASFLEKLCQIYHLKDQWKEVQIIKTLIMDALNQRSERLQGEGEKLVITE